MTTEAVGDPSPKVSRRFFGPAVLECRLSARYLRGYALESLTDPEAVLVIDAEPDKQMIQ